MVVASGSIAVIAHGAICRIRVSASQARCVAKVTCAWVIVVAICICHASATTNYGRMNTLCRRCITAIRGASIAVITVHRGVITGTSHAGISSTKIRVIAIRCGHAGAASSNGSVKTRARHRLAAVRGTSIAVIAIHSGVRAGATYASIRCAGVTVVAVPVPRAGTTTSDWRMTTLAGHSVARIGRA
jgi:hypothetical protein